MTKHQLHIVHNNEDNRSEKKKQQINENWVKQFYELAKLKRTNFEMIHQSKSNQTKPIIKWPIKHPFISFTFDCVNVAIIMFDHLNKWMIWMIWMM